MHAILKSGLQRGLLLSVCIAGFGGSGCSTYFRGGERSSQELQDRNQTKQSEDKVIFKPDTVIYSK